MVQSATPLSDSERIERMRHGGRILADILREVLSIVKPGITTWTLEERARELITENIVKPAFQGYEGYPAVLCVGPNEIVVHGIPDETVLNEGDIVSVDAGIIYEGVYLDMARTVPVGDVPDETKKFLHTVESALSKACSFARTGNTVGDIGHAISSTAESEGYSVVREMVGHGVGLKLHEDPMIPGYGRRGEGDVLYEGQTIAIEAIINQGRPEIIISKEDGWTSWTKDGKLSALFENTVLVSKRCQILTPL